MAEKKEKKTEVKKETKDEIKKVEEVEEVKVDVEEVPEKIEEAVEAEVVETDEETKGNTKFVINIVAIVLIALILILGLVLVFIKPSPKQTANDFLNLLGKNPVEAVIKYGVSEFDQEIEREKAKYTSYKILKVDEVTIENGKEKTQVFYTKKGPNSFKVTQEVTENLEKRNITEENENFNAEFLKELKKVLKEKKDQLEEIQDALVLTRSKGERNWTISSLPN